MSPTSSPTPSLSSREHRSPSPRNSPGIDLSRTPTSKVKAILAGFSSDSDSDEPVSKPKSKVPAKQSSAALSNDEDEDDVPVVRTRVRATKKIIIPGSDDEEDEDIEMADADAPKMSAADRIRQQLLGKKKKEAKEIPPTDKDEDGELTPKPVRRRILKKKSSPINSPTTSPTRSAAKSASPTPIDETATKAQKPKKSGLSRGRKSVNHPKKSKKTATNDESGSEPNLAALDSDSGSLPSLDEDDSFEALVAESKLLRLANEKRKAIKEKQDAEEAKRQARLEAMQDIEDGDMMFSEDDDNTGKKRAPKKRTQRKASKKAEFEMRAETQRLARNQNFQLEPRPKKIHPVADLWAIFGAKNPNAPPEPEPESSSSAPKSEVENSSPPTSFITSPATKGDANSAAQPKETVDDDDGALKDDDDMPTLEQLMQESHAPKAPETLQKGKGKATDKDVEMLDIPKNKKLGFASLPKSRSSIKRQPREEFVVPATSSPLRDGDSDSDDLEIIKPEPPAPKPRSDPLKDLRRFANHNADSFKPRGRYAKGPQRDPEWEIKLKQKVAEQIKRDEEERKAAFSRQGIHIPSQEEIIQEASVVEDLVEKSRQEALEQRDRERREEAQRRGIKLADLSDDSDDSDWRESGAEDENDGEEPVYSGSESEHEEEEEPADADMEMEDNVDATPPSAQRSSSPIRLSDMPPMAESDEDDDDLKNAASTAAQRRQRARAIVKDDDDEEEIDVNDSITQIPSSMESSSKNISFGKSSGLPMGLTQMFNSSMESDFVDSTMQESANGNISFGAKAQAPLMSMTQMFNSQAESQSETDENPLADFKSNAPVMSLTQMFDSQADSQPELSGAETPTKDNPFAGFKSKAPIMGLTQMFESSMDSQEVGDRMDRLRQDIPDDLNISQIPLEMGLQTPKAQTQASFLDLAYSQSQIQDEPESLLNNDLGFSTQMSYNPEPTPDRGFQYNPSEAPPRFQTLSQMTQSSDYNSRDREVLQSGLTEATVLLSPQLKAPRKKGRLIRRNRAVSEDSGSEKEASASEAEESESEEPVNAFNLLGKKPKKDVESFDKKKAKGMFQEAAEESEDEYAGLGGYSDDEETDEEELAAEMADMIDNETKDEDDRKHAELDLERDVAEDGKMIERITKDLKTGKLRRGGARGAIDDDSDDELRDQMLRRQRKNAIERRRLLLQDENLAKLDKNPRREAFLKTIENDKAYERNILDEEDEDFDFAMNHDDSQSQLKDESIVQVPDSQLVGEEAGSDSNEPATQVPDSPSQVAVVAETPHKPEKPGNPRRTNDPSKKRKQHPHLHVQRTISSIVDDDNDRYKMDSSDSDDLEIEDPLEMTKRRKIDVIDRVAAKRSATTTTESTRLAFYQNGTDSSGQFKVPSMLRRSTTQSSGASETTTVAPKSAFVETTTKMARGKAGGASINFQAREATRQKNLEKAASGRRKEEKKVMGARRANAASVFNAGGFS